MSSNLSKLSPKSWQTVELLCATAEKGLDDCYSNIDLLGRGLTADNDNLRLNMPWNLRYITMVQIGIKNRLKFYPNNESPLPDLWQYIWSRRQEVDNAGDLGLAIWAGVKSDVDDSKVLAQKLANKWSHLRYACNAVELAWVVQAIICFLQYHHRATDEISDVLNDARDRLMALHCHDTGLFARHNRSGLREVISRYTACFADQVYPILALANYGRHFDEPRSVNAAAAAADSICRLQGPKGQWWWHYNVKTGTVAEEYPVFSVHQDSMAPMALLAIDKVAGTNHSANIEKGLMWLNKSNELSETMITPGKGVIWRDIHRREIPKMYRYVRGALITAGWDAAHRLSGKNLFGYVLNRECRPYHLGWVLYAWAGRLPKPPTSPNNSKTKILPITHNSESRVMRTFGTEALNSREEPVDILGLPVSPLTMEQLLLLADKHMASCEPLLLGVVNAAKFVNVRRYPELRQSLKQAHLILADGLSVVWLSRLMGTALPERIAGIDVMYRLLERSSAKNRSVYFLGASRSVVTEVVKSVSNNYPGLRIAGFRDGFFNKAEEKTVVDEIRKSKPDILFVAMPTPKKENFLAKWHNYINVPVCHGVGGSFDVLAGLTKRAPFWMQKSGLEWLYRVIQEPRRMWRRYLITNTIFIKLSLQAIIRARFGRLFHAILAYTSPRCQKPR